MKLSTYLKQTGASVASFAERVGVKRHTIYRLIDGSRHPSAGLGFSIEKATHGKVTLYDFFRAKQVKVKDELLTPREQ